MLQYYDFNAPVSGAEFRISSAGSYIRYYAGSAAGLDNRITLKCDSRGLSVILKPGQAIRMDDATEVVDWRISNYAKQGLINGFVVIGDGILDDSTVTGEVTVTDGGLIRTLAGQAFTVGAFCAAVAAQYSHLQLYNPSGSGKNLFVESVIVSSSTAENIYVGYYSAAYPTLMNNGLNKLLGGATGVGVARKFNDPALTYVAVGMQVPVAINVVQKLQLAEPIVVPPGIGLIVVGTTLAADLTADFEWYEQSQ